MEDFSVWFWVFCGVMLLFLYNRLFDKIKFGNPKHNLFCASCKHRGQGRCVDKKGNDTACKYHQDKWE